MLRTETEPVTEDSPALQTLIDDMIETMRAAEGVGLAAPQVGRRERVFVVDVTPMLDDAGQEFPPQPMVLINPDVVWESEEDVEFEEGCLSIPDVRELVVRPAHVRVRYLDRHFALHEIDAGEVLARVFQHEIDHLEGVLFIDHISAFRRRLLRRRLREMARGDVEAEYLISTNGA